MSEPLPQGWALPPGARRWHFCIGRDAVCRLWILAPGTPLLAALPDATARCWRCARWLRNPRVGGRREE